MGIRMMCVVVAVTLPLAVSFIMVMVMIVVVVVVMPMIVGFRLTRADAFNMVVMAFLRQTDLGLEAEHLFAILAELAVHVVLATADLVDALHECLDHHRVVVQIRRLDEFDIGMPGRDQVGVFINPTHQYAGK